MITIDLNPLRLIYLFAIILSIFLVGLLIGRIISKRKSIDSTNEKTNTILITPKCANISNFEQIQVILAEYSHREEEKNIVATGVNNIISIAVAVFAGILIIIYEAKIESLSAILPTLILLFASMEFSRHSSVLYHAMYLELLEERVNRLSGKELMMWASKGSSYHNVILKFRIKNNISNTRVININPIIVFIYLVLILVLFIFSLNMGYHWIESTSTVSSWLSKCIPLLYLSLHIFFLLLIICDRWKSPKVIDVVKKNLRKEIIDADHDALEKTIPSAEI